VRQLTVAIEASVMEVQQDGSLVELAGDHVPVHIQSAIADAMDMAMRRLQPVAKTLQVSVDLVSDGKTRP